MFWSMSMFIPWSSVYVFSDETHSVIMNRQFNTCSQYMIHLSYSYWALNHKGKAFFGNHLNYFLWFLPIKSSRFYSYTAFIKVGIVTACWIHIPIRNSKDTRFMPLHMMQSKGKWHSSRLVKLLIWLCLRILMTLTGEIVGTMSYCAKWENQAFGVF